MNAQVRVSPPSAPPVTGAPSPAEPASAAPSVRVHGGPSFALLALERLDLAAIVLTLFLCLLALQAPFTIEYAGLAVVAVLVASRCITPPNLRSILAFGAAPPRAVARLTVEWGYVVGILLLAGFALKISDWYSRAVLLPWFAATPLALLVGQDVQVRVARLLSRRGQFASRCIIVGVNQTSAELARRLPQSALLGCFDFREPERLKDVAENLTLLGHCRLVGDFVRRQAVNSVYIALPITNSPRLQALLSDLRNTTASVYFVPDIFAFDLIQARVVDVNGMPALGICDTPLHGTDAVSKRLMDIALGTLGLLALSPLLLAVAVAIKASSPGTVLFRQRRYGLAGEEFVVYKFRSMTVCEDGPDIRQASQSDARFTLVGRFIRRTSIDELPQLWNVLTGSMSLVGPRPHAVAHNEQYRRMISGYMLRHKVRPGITGWAQVHGLRGETDTVDKMAQRVRYDLEYLNSWSLMLDVQILLRTVLVVLRGANAH